MASSGVQGENQLEFVLVEVGMRDLGFDVWVSGEMRGEGKNFDFDENE